MLFTFLKKMPSYDENNLEYISLYYSVFILQHLLALMKTSELKMMVYLSHLKGFW